MIVILPVEVKKCVAITHRDTHIIGLVDDHSAAISDRKQVNVLMLSPSPVGM